MTSVSRSNRASREQASPRCGALHGYADDAPHMDVNMDMDMGDGTWTWPLDFYRRAQSADPSTERLNRTRRPPAASARRRASAADPQPPSVEFDSDRRASSVEEGLLHQPILCSF